MTELELVYRSQLYYSFGSQGDEVSSYRCTFGPYDGRRGGGLDYARLRFGDDGRFSLYAETKLTYAGAETTVARDTFDIAGDYERRGPLLELRLDGGDYVWYGTAGPDPRSPTTVVLGDYSPEGIAFGGGGSQSSRECGLALLTPEGVDPDWSIAPSMPGSRSGPHVPAPRSESYDFQATVTRGVVRRLPFIFGRLANNRVEGGTLTLKPDGTYHVVIRGVNGDSYNVSNTAPYESEAEGTYVDYGGLIAFDIGTSRLGFGVVDGASLRVLVEDGPRWPIAIVGDADRLFVRN
ncbi:hypothetical protein [Rubrivirga sp.]|uniref:hypothetical protein n=1 Tax=Rubrivirga sp. TaxID=1885344 RepID=UPI003C771A32